MLAGATLIAIGAYLRNPTPLYYQYQSPDFWSVLRQPLAGVKDLFFLIRRWWNTYGKGWAHRGERLLRVVWLVAKFVTWILGLDNGQADPPTPPNDPPTPPND